MDKTTRLIMNVVIAVATLFIIIFVEDRTVNLHQINTLLLVVVTIVSYFGFAYMVLEKKNSFGVLFILIPFGYLGGTILSIVLEYNPAFSVISGELIGLAIITCYPLIIWGVLEQKYKLAIITFYAFTATQFFLFYMEQRLLTIDNANWVVVLIILTVLLVWKNKNYRRNTAMFESIVNELYSQTLSNLHIKEEDGIIEIRGLSEQMLVEITDDGELSYCMHFTTGLMKRIVYTKRTRNIKSLSPEQNSIFKNYVNMFAGKKGIVIEPNLIRMKFRSELGYKKLLSSLFYKRKIRLYSGQLNAAIRLTNIL